MKQLFNWKKYINWNLDIYLHKQFVPSLSINQHTDQLEGTSRKKLNNISWTISAGIFHTYKLIKFIWLIYSDNFCFWFTLSKKQNTEEVNVTDRWN